MGIERCEGERKHLEEKKLEKEASTVSVLPADVTTIPYEYQIYSSSFRYWGYSIKPLLPKGVYNESDDSQDDFPLLAKVISRKAFNYGIYEVYEYRYSKNGSVVNMVITTLAEIEEIDFENNGFISLPKTSLSINNKDSNKTHPEYCEYKINWKNDNINIGRIYRRCVNASEKDYYHVATFIGNNNWGINFYSPDEITCFGRMTKSDYWWNYWRRDIIILPNVPFPPILPTLYSAFYDYLETRQKDYDTIVGKLAPATRNLELSSALEEMKKMESSLHEALNLISRDQKISQEFRDFSRELLKKK
ncbi:4717_t:CDS:2 [Entrophospora sp. SA101]|nr:4717_t:CDS:2 [Entrophospora sp. SA101]